MISVIRRRPLGGSWGIRGGARNVRAWVWGFHGSGKCWQVVSDLVVALSVSHSTDQWLDWDTRRKQLERRGCSFFMLQQAVVSLPDALESRIRSGVVLPWFSLGNQQLHLFVWASDWRLSLPAGAGMGRRRLKQFDKLEHRKKTREGRRSTIVQVTWLRFKVKCFDFKCWVNQAEQAWPRKPKLLALRVIICVALVRNVIPSSPKSIFWDTVTGQYPLWVLWDACLCYLPLPWSVLLKLPDVRALWSNSRMPSKKGCCVLGEATVVIL